MAETPEWFVQVTDAIDRLLSDESIAGGGFTTKCSPQCFDIEFWNATRTRVSVGLAEPALYVKVTWQVEIKRKRRVAPRKRVKRGGKTVRKTRWDSEIQTRSESAEYTVNKAEKVALALGARGLAEKITGFILEVNGNHGS